MRFTAGVLEGFGRRLADRRKSMKIAGMRVEDVSGFEGRRRVAPLQTGEISSPAATSHNGNVT